MKLLLKRGVPKEDLIVFDLNKDQLKDLVWLKKNEFDLNGNLFDVVRKYKRKDGSCLFECISDKQEEVLFAHLKVNISTNLGDDHNPTPVSNWMKILQVPIIPFCSSIEIPFLFLTTKKENLYYYLSNNSLQSVRIDCPPPQVA